MCYLYANTFKERVLSRIPSIAAVSEIINSIPFQIETYKIIELTGLSMVETSCLATEAKDLCYYLFAERMK